MQAPLSPAEAEREQERISLLIDINTELIKELVRIQTEGGTSAPGQSPNQVPSVNEPKKEDKDGQAPAPNQQGQYGDFVE